MAHRLLEALPGRIAFRRLRPPPLDQAPAQPLGGFGEVALAHVHQPRGISVTRRAKLSASIRRRAWDRVRPRVAVAVSPSTPSPPGPRPSKGTAGAAT